MSEIPFEYGQMLRFKHPAILHSSCFECGKDHYEEYEIGDEVETGKVNNESGYFNVSAGGRGVPFYDYVLDGSWAYLFEVVEEEEEHE
jgi:hypothetical protein